MLGTAERKGIEMKKKLLLLAGLVAAGAVVATKRKQAAAAEQALWDEATGNSAATASPK